MTCSCRVGLLFRNIISKLIDFGMERDPAALDLRLQRPRPPLARVLAFPVFINVEQCPQIEGDPGRCAVRTSRMRAAGELLRQRGLKRLSS